MDQALVRQIDAGMERRLHTLRTQGRSGPDRLGWKVAMNNPASRAAFGLDGWLVGALPASTGLSEGSFKREAGSDLHLEAEIAVRLGTSLPPRASADEALESIDCFAPAIELVDFALPRATLEEITAHAFFHVACWVGTGTGTYGPMALQLPIVRRNGEVIASPDPTRALADPTPIVQGVAELLERYEERLEGGDWILCGSLIEPVSAEALDLFSIDFGALGTLEMRIDG